MTIELASLFLNDISATQVHFKYTIITFITRYTCSLTQENYSLINLLIYKFLVNNNVTRQKNVIEANRKS
jgi:hypothetical protein